MPAKDQWDIAVARPGDELTVIVKPEMFTGLARYSARRYAVLSSGGFGLRIKEHKKDGGRIAVTGTVMAEGENV